jgi:hypothetical protein
MYGLDKPNETFDSAQLPFPSAQVCWAYVKAAYIHCDLPLSALDNHIKPGPFQSRPPLPLPAIPFPPAGPREVSSNQGVCACFWPCSGGRREGPPAHRQDGRPAALPAPRASRHPRQLRERALLAGEPTPHAACHAPSASFLPCLFLDPSNCVGALREPSLFRVPWRF